MCEGAKTKMVVAFDVEHGSLAFRVWLRLFTTAGETRPTRRKCVLLRRVP